MEKRFTLFLFGLLLSLGTAFGQTKINGTVVSQDDGEAVIGASVMVQGTTTGTVTDIDGHFTLDVPAGKKLVVSYIGMVTQTVAAKDGMKVVLSNDNHQLNEVVVTGMTHATLRLSYSLTVEGCLTVNAVTLHTCVEVYDVSIVEYIIISGRETCVPAEEIVTSPIENTAFFED